MGVIPKRRTTCAASSVISAISSSNPPAARARSHIPRILRVPPRAISMRPIPVYVGSAKVTVATHALDRRSSTGMAHGAIANTRRSKGLAAGVASLQSSS
jgi:hypothetical protein